VTQDTVRASRGTAPEPGGSVGVVTGRRR
jgi:hypothetical protein